MKHLVLTLALLLPLSAHAETREDRVAAAEEYVELALAGFDMAAVIETMYQPLLQQVAAGGQTLSEDQVMGIRQLYLDTFNDPMLKLMRDQSQIMADIMTLGEITALRDFYATPEGKSVMAKLPQLTAAQQPGVMQLVNDNMAGLMPQVLAIINGE
ncbi:MAG: hypothetical protein C0524_04930 [Rhodobacter sp.]|nr:hypothetical protein [Rhodobacter sp.]